MREYSLFSKCLIIFLLLFLCSCSVKKEGIYLGTKPISINKFNTPPGADPNIPAEKGGEGFKGEGWKTKVEYNVIGKKEAVKGGKFEISFTEFPNSIRIYGKDSNFEFNIIYGELIYESLLNLDPVDKTLIPCLATHWKVESDSVTFRYRINPDARWADGMPVTSNDVLATYNLLTDTTLGVPFINSFFQTFEKPVIESKYIFTIKSKEKNWRQFVYASTFQILPEHIIKDLSGSKYNEQYQFKCMVGSGPYTILDEDIKKGESITLRRRSDYWGEKEKFNTGKNNFDEIVMHRVMDDLLEFEKFKKGELDIYRIKKPETFKTGFNFDYAERNLVIRKKVYNNEPLGITGFVFNLREKPFDDIRVRKAFIHLFNKTNINEKLFENSYSLYNSYFPNSEFTNPTNPVIGYNYDSAMVWLKEAGWIMNPSNGKLEKDGKQLEVTLPFTKPMDRYLTIYQEDLQKAGIKLELKETDMPTRFSLGNERKFKIIPVQWMGMLIPNPVSFLSSETADAPGTNNWSGLKDGRIDSLCKLYDLSYTSEEQKKVLQEIDKIAYSYFAMIDGFYRSYRSYAFHNKFGYPDGITGKYDSFHNIFSYWYIDTDRYEKYQKAVNDKSVKLPEEEIENKYWRNKK